MIFPCEIRRKGAKDHGIQLLPFLKLIHGEIRDHELCLRVFDTKYKIENK